MARFSVEDAARFMRGYLEDDPEQFDICDFVRYVETVDGQSETCGGCTLGDGQDCWPPVHYIDVFDAVSSKVWLRGGRLAQRKRYSTLFLGWAEGGCSNSFGDYNVVRHERYEDERRVSFTDYAALQAAGSGGGT